MRTYTDAMVFWTQLLVEGGGVELGCAFTSGLKYGIQSESVGFKF